MRGLFRQLNPGQFPLLLLTESDEHEHFLLYCQQLVPYYMLMTVQVTTQSLEVQLGVLLKLCFVCYDLLFLSNHYDLPYQALYHLH